MMTVTEKAAYLKGLAEGLELDEKKPETKLIKAMIDVIDEMALSISDFEDSLDMVGEQLVPSSSAETLRRFTALVFTLYTNWS